MLRMKGLLFCAVLMLGTGWSVLAQTQTPKADNREQRQKARIKEGKQSDELTEREAARLKARQKNIKADEAAAKADGKVTAAERRRLQREQDRASRAIYRQKHDAQRKPR